MYSHPREFSQTRSHDVLLEEFALLQNQESDIDAGAEVTTKPMTKTGQSGPLALGLVDKTNSEQAVVSEVTSTKG